MVTLRGHLVDPPTQAVLRDATREELAYALLRQRDGSSSSIGARIDGTLLLCDVVITAASSDEDCADCTPRIFRGTPCDHELRDIAYPLPARRS